MRLRPRLACVSVVMWMPLKIDLRVKFIVADKEKGSPPNDKGVLWQISFHQFHVSGKFISDIIK